MTLTDHAALSQVVFNYLALTTGIWVVFQYVASRRTAAARWMQELFERFYVDDSFAEGRELLEYDYVAVTVPLLRLRVSDRDIALDSDQRRTLSDLDKTLNYFEHLIYLEEVGNIRRRDRLVFFEHWFDLIASAPYATLRRYLNLCGYERLAGLTRVDGRGYLVPTPAMAASASFADLVACGALTRDRAIALPLAAADGDLGFTPDRSGLAPTWPVYRTDERRALHRLDALFSDRPTGRNLRRCFHVPSQKRDVWIYVTGPLDPLPDA